MLDIDTLEKCYGENNDRITDGQKSKFNIIL